GKVAVDGDVVGVEDFGNVRNRGDGDAAFVDAAVDGDVRVAVNDAGRDVHSGTVDNLRAGRSFNASTDLGDLAVLNKDGTVLDGAFSDGEDGGVLNEDDGGSVGRRRGHRGHRDE